MCQLTVTEDNKENSVDLSLSISDITERLRNANTAPETICFAYHQEQAAFSGFFSLLYSPLRKEASDVVASRTLSSNSSRLFQSTTHPQPSNRKRQCKPQYKRKRLQPPKYKRKRPPLTKPKNQKTLVSYLKK